MNADQHRCGGRDEGGTVSNVGGPYSLPLPRSAFLVVCSLSAFICVHLWPCFPASPAVAADKLEFRVTLSPELADQPLSGRLFVFLTKKEQGEPRMGPNWFAPEPFFGLEAPTFVPGEALILDDGADGFPKTLSSLPAGRWRAQAVLHVNFDAQNPGTGEANPKSEPVMFDFDGQGPLSVTFTLNSRIPSRTFPDVPWIKEVARTSRLLSDFHGHEVIERCAVVLPDGYGRDPNRRFPTLYTIGGFTSSHWDALGHQQKPPKAGEGEADFIRVYLNGNCLWGHHVYADSATNGPRGRALIEELIPHIDATWSTIADPSARFVTGHSSGGWSSLWLQVTYPDTFGGVWSLSPDPVDFRDYQQVNLYADPPQSLYQDEQGNRRPIARRGTKPVLWYDDFGKMDDVLYRGGQLRSFEAVFSPRGDDGLPRRLWDRTTGRIDPAVAQAWEAYDIRLVIERNWPTLKDKLAGKLYITMGTLDTFYLEGATIRLAETLKQLGSDANVEIIEGADHGNYLTAERVKRIRRQMAEQLRKAEGKRQKDEG